MIAERLILHIGHGKTGSTSIQRTLRASDEALGRAGVLFPDPGRHDNHQLLFPHLWGVLPDDPVQLASLGTNPSEIRDHAAARFEDLKARIAADAPRDVVLSCENQFRTFPPEAFARLTRTCAELARRVEVVAYLRGPASYALSKVQQDVKKRPEFLYLSQTRLRDVLEPFLEHGPGPLTAVRFARDALADGDVVSDFVTRMLPRVDRDALIRGKDEDNTTVSAEAMAVLQELFRDTRPLPAAVRADKKAFRKIVVATDATLPGAARPRLHDAVREVIEARVTEAPWLKERLGLVFPEQQAPKMSPAQAEERYSRLHDIADLCPVDAARKSALWQASLDAAEARGSVLGRLLRRMTGRR